MKLIFYINIFQGFLIGVGAIAPGFSGSAMAVGMGVYDKIIGACNGLISDFRNFKKHFMYLLPFAIGGMAGVFLLSKLIAWMFAEIPVISIFIFLGLLLGSMPSVIDNANTKGFKAQYLLFAAVFFILALLMGENHQAESAGTAPASFVMFVLYGGILGLGTVIPGLSSSFMLMNIGAYTMVINAISKLVLADLIPILIGFAVVIAVCIKIVNYLILNFHGYLYYAMIGLVFGSMVKVIPPLHLFSELLISIFICCICCISSFLSFKINFQYMQQ